MRQSTGAKQKADEELQHERSRLEKVEHSRDKAEAERFGSHNFPKDMLAHNLIPGVQETCAISKSLPQSFQRLGNS